MNGIVGSAELLTSSDTLNSVDMENELPIKSCLNTIVDISDNDLMAAKSSYKSGDARKMNTFRLASTVDAVSEICASTVSDRCLDLKVFGSRCRGAGDGSFAAAGFGEPRSKCQHVYPKREYCDSFA